jgi:ABC-type transport system involved in multi-copper enzyme maturation permease subunit
MIASILLFELRQRLRRISTYIYFIVFFGLGFLFVNLAGGAIPGGSVDFGTGGKVLLNSPWALMLVIAYVSFFGVIITAALAGQATYQDVDHNCAAFFYTAPISKFDYLGGRFLGSLVAQLFIFSSVGLGTWIGTHMPWLDRTRFGPENLLGYLQPYIALVLPNLFFTTAIFFAIAVLARKMLPVYVGSVLLLVGYFAAAQLSNDPIVTPLAALADPFGGNAFGRLTQYWTPFEKNTRLIPVAGILLANRALWIGVGIVILGFAYSRFSFSRAMPVGKRRKQAGAPEAEAIVPVARLLPAVHPVFSVGASFGQLVSFTRLQFTETVRNVFFAVLVLSGYLLAVLTASDVTDPSSNPVYPVTYRMIENAGGSFTIFALAIITFVAGELVWRERDAQIDQITDALPVQRWVMFASKLFALILVQVVLVLAILAAGLSVQIAKGYSHFEFGLYLTSLFGVLLTRFWVLCVLALFIHTIVNQKYLGHFVVVLYLIASIALPPIGFQHFLYRFGQSPPFIYSDMNGYGPFAAPLFWFHVYWGIAAIVLAIITNLLWVRGTETGWQGRLSLAAENLSGPSRAGLAACCVLFFAVGGYIFYNTDVVNAYRTTFREDDARAQYEKKYRQYLSMAQPRTTDVNTQIDLDPANRFAAIQGTEWLENKTDAAIDRIAVTIWPQDLAPIPLPHIRIDKLSFQGGQSLVVEDPALGFYLYRLATPLAPHARVALEFSLTYPNPGFVNSRPNTDIVHNGSFLNSSYIPFVGYFPDVELTDDSTRHRHGLEVVKRLAKLEDVGARQNNAITVNADWINFEGTVSTSPDQIAIMPGYLQKEWVENGRRYFHYKMDAPILPIVSLNSARYAVQRDHWHDVNLEIYYHAGHEFDLDRMMRSMKATLDYCTTAFSPFQYRQLRIIEFPRYGTFAESFPNTIPFSESIGFITYVNPKKTDAIDLPFFVTAHEVGHQWWAHQVISANVEGATSIVETLAQYTALMVMQHTYGQDSMKKFLRFELDGYLRGRGQERNEERPLYRVEPNQGYIHYNKGGLVMYALQDYIGEAAVSQALAAFTKDYAFKGAPYPTSLDFIGYLRKVTPPEYLYLFDDFFENITIYDNRAVSATYTQKPDGKFEVYLVVEAKKFRADGKGQEHPVPPNDYVDIGVLDAEGHFLYLQKHKLDKENAEFTVTVERLPAQAGIDPLIKLIDRNPDDNAIKVEKR